MKNFSVDIDCTVSNDWWKKLIEHFVRVDDPFEIRCWKEEPDEIKQAMLYGGPPVEEGFEVSIKGNVSMELLNELINSPEPTDKDIYNKMTRYFTINIKNELCDLCSEHYGTEIYVAIMSEDDTYFFKQVMNLYPEAFSVREW